MPTTYRTFILLVLLLASTAAQVEGSTVAFGSNGELYRVREGRYGLLFPGGPHEIGNQTHVLALEIIQNGEEIDRRLVPGTESLAIDRHPALVVDQDSGHLFLLWESKIDPTLSKLNLVGFGSGEWGEVIELSGDPQPLKGTPELALVRDTDVPFEPRAQARTRTFVHHLWWEEGEDDGDVYYAPVVFLNDEYLGWNPVLRLQDLDPSPSVEAVAPPRTLLRAPTIDVGRDDHSMIIGLANRRTNRFLTIQVRVLPAVLSNLAGGVKGHIVGFGNRVNAPTMETLAGGVRGRIVGFGSRLHAGVREYLAQEASDEILSFGPTLLPEDLQEIAELAQGRVLDAGRSLLGREFVDPSPRSCNVVHLGATPDTPRGDADHHIELCLVASRPLPLVGDGPTTIFVSDDGQDVLVAWEENRTLLYRKSIGDGWTDIRTAPPHAGNMVQAKEFLRQMIRVH